MLALLRPKFRQPLALAIALLACAAALPVVAQPQADGSLANGHLIAVGGAMRDPAILHRFIKLAGGPDAPIVVIPTAGAGEEYDSDWVGLRAFRTAGATNLRVLHTRDRKVADSEEFVAPLRTARGVFIAGGRQTRLAKAYLDTRTHRELRAVLERGGVVGGSSAGASILASFLMRGDTRSNKVPVGEYLRGFGLLPHSAIDQHVLRRNRQFDLAPIVRAHPELLGIGIDEDTAIVLSGGQFEVIGQSYVIIHDARSSSRNTRAANAQAGRQSDPARDAANVAAGRRTDPARDAANVAAGRQSDPVPGAADTTSRDPGNGTAGSPDARRERSDTTNDATTRAGATADPAPPPQFYFLAPGDRFNLKTRQ
ncbi:MAG: cyanophycinase, partial [Candidatus Acidiferrales bacterium]